MLPGFELEEIKMHPRPRAAKPVKAALRRGRAVRAPERLGLQRTSKSMLRLGVSGPTLATSQGSNKPRPQVNSVSTPTLTRQPQVHAPHAHKATSDYRLYFSHKTTTGQFICINQTEMLCVTDLEQLISIMNCGQSTTNCKMAERYLASFLPTDLSFKV